jgi:hypothetical protein
MTFDDLFIGISKEEVSEKPHKGGHNENLEEKIIDEAFDRIDALVTTPNSQGPPWVFICNVSDGVFIKGTGYGILKSWDTEQNYHVDVHFDDGGIERLLSINKSTYERFTRHIEIGQEQKLIKIT